MYQIAPYIGFPKTVEAIENMNDVFKADHIRLPLPEQGTVTEQNRLEQGLAVQKGIYGEYIDQMRATAPVDQKVVQDDLSAVCFGDTYTRGTLNLKLRELLTLAVIATLGGAEPQLKGHIQRNINVGNDRGTIWGAIIHCMPYIGFLRTLNALRCFNEVLPLK